MLVPELLVSGIFGLVQSVRVDEQRPALDTLNFLSLEFHPGQYADGRVGEHLDEVSSQDGRVVTGVAEREMPCLQVEKADEHSDKHTAFVVLSRKCVVDVRANLRGGHPLLGQGLEQAGGLGHEQRSGHALSAYVSHYEIKLVFS